MSPLSRARRRRALTRLLSPTPQAVVAAAGLGAAAGLRAATPLAVLQVRRGLLPWPQGWFLLAGRAGEELIFGEDKITTGASNDIEKVSTQMVNFISTYGMDEDFGIFNINVLSNGNFGTGTTEARFVDLCRDRLKILYIETKELLSDNLADLKKIALELLNRESLNHDEIEEILKYKIPA